MKTYEGIFIFQSSLDDDGLSKQIEAIRTEVTTLEGQVISATRMGKNVFARPMKKREAGIYVLMVFEIAPSKISQLKDRYKFNADLLRAHITTARKIRPAARP